MLPIGQEAVRAARFDPIKFGIINGMKSIGSIPMPGLTAKREERHLKDENRSPHSHPQFHHASKFQLILKPNCDETLPRTAGYKQALLDGAVVFGNAMELLRGRRNQITLGAGLPVPVVPCL